MLFTVISFAVVLLTTSCRSGKKNLIATYSVGSILREGEHCPAYLRVAGSVKDGHPAESNYLLTPFTVSAAKDSLTFVTPYPYYQWSDSINNIPIYPVWIRYYDREHSGAPMWGFINLTSTNQVEGIVSAGYSIVDFGNFADKHYADPSLKPFYDGKGAFWDPFRREYLDSSNPPQQFLLPVWLDKNNQ